MADELRGVVLDDSGDITLRELCQTCRVSAERIRLLVEEGVIEPRGREPAQWRFERISIVRVRKVQRLETDLGLNLAGAALALELMDELEVLRRRLRHLDSR